LQGKSITEAEFHWACDCRKKEELAVFLPDHDSEFAGVLRKRAEGQSEDEKKAQEQFHRFLCEKGTVCKFRHAGLLSNMVAEIVRIWCGGGLYATAPASPVITRTLDVEAIGRREHREQFDCTLAILPPQARLA